MKAFLLLLGLSFGIRGQAWQNGPVPVVLTGCPAGMYARLTEPLPYTTGYLVYRKEPGTAYKLIGRHTPCAGSAMLYRRMTAYAHILSDYALPTKALSDALWKAYHADAREHLLHAEMPLLQLATGNCFLDTSARQGRTYQYRFQFTDSLRSVESLPVAYLPHQAQYAAMRVLRVVPDKKKSLLEWRTAAVNAAPFFQVYRRQSGAAIGFQSIHATRGTRKTARADSIIFMVIDSSAAPGITYDYYLVAKDFLGNSGNHSDTVRLQSGGRQNVPSVFNLRTRSDSSGIRLLWAPLARNTALQNIIVLRSDTHDTGYAPIALLPVTDTSYTDKSAVGGQRYFYQLIVQGGLNYSLPTPRVSGMYTGGVNLLPPYGLEALPLRGGVRLSWRYGDPWNISGYKVYRAVSPLGKMQLISDLLPPRKDSLPVEFTDTTAGSDKTTWYYAVEAISRTSMPGPLSNIVTGAPTAISRVPAPAGMRYLWLNDSVVSVTWRDLQRGTPGVTHYQVYKRTADMDSLAPGEFLRATVINEFTDTLGAGAVRWYCVTAVNTTGISSVASSPLRIEAPVHKPLPPGRVRAYRQQKHIVLNWDGSMYTGVMAYHIYKAENNGKMALVDSLPATRQPYQYVDQAIRPGKMYFYYVTAVTGRGQESERSAEVHVRMD